MTALAEYVPAFLQDLVLSPLEQAATAANGDGSVASVRAVPWVSARDPDGKPYDGDLIADVVRYRELRSQSLSGEILGGEAFDELAALEARLRQPRPSVTASDDEPAVLRSFFRFECDFPARIRAGIVDAQFDVRDISAGGVKLVGEHRFTPGDTASLVVEVGSHHLAFPSRVAWVKDDCFGLMFAGAARPARG